LHDLTVKFKERLNNNWSGSLCVILSGLLIKHMHLVFLELR